MKKRFLGLICILVICLFVLVAGFCTEFVYVNPQVNTQVFPYISKSIKLIDDGLNYALDACNSNGMKLKFNFKNAYGSGFLKYNPIPNDLDYAVGVNLGKYKYNGTNSKEIAVDLVDKMSLFQTEYYNYVNSVQNDVLYATTTPLGFIISSSESKEKNIESIASSFDNIFADKDYVKYTKKEINNGDYINFPFILKPNEVLVEDSSPITLFSDKVNYSKNDEKYLREITIVLDYSFEVENTLTNETKDVEIIAESFTGQRLQLSRRFFVPIVFVGEYSAKYLKNLSYLNNDEEYLSYRLFNYKRHLQEIVNINEFNDRPVKLLKRVLQCADLIYPVLSDDERVDIYQKVSENLNNRDVQLLNTYSTALGNLYQIIQYPKLFSMAYDNGDIYKIFDVMDDSLNELENRGNQSKSDLAVLKKYDKDILNSIKDSRTRVGFQLFKQKMFKDRFITSVELVVKMLNKTIKNRVEIEAFAKNFVTILEKAGFHRVDLYWLGKDVLGVLKDDFTGLIKEEELHRMALENDLVDVRYKFVNIKQVPPTAVRYTVWVRYNSTNEENKNWEILKSKLIRDKNNFNIKRKIVF